MPSTHRPTWVAALASGAAAATVFALVAALRGTVPFGSASRAVDDLGNQGMPFHSMLWQVLHGSPLIDWQWNWLAGGGVLFWPEYGSYLADPTSLLIGLFPHEALDMGIFVIILVRLALAAALMTVLLRATRPQGSPWVAAGLGAAYAASGWTFNDAEYQIQWLSGLAALPALTIAGLWAVRKERFVASVLVVAVCWWSNYYSVYMASLGAAALVATLTFGEGATARGTLAGMIRFAGRGLLGVALTGALLIPSVLAALTGRPTPAHSLGAAPWSWVAARLFPMTEAVNYTPALFVGSATLLLALALPWHTALPARLRASVGVGFIAVLLSQQWAPTQLVWNAFDEPNGSAFRPAFVLCAFGVLAAWICVADRLPSLRALAPAAVLMAGLGIVAWSAAGPWGDGVAVHGAALAVAGIVALATVVGVGVLSARPHRLGAAAVVGVLSVAWGAEAVATGVFIEDSRERVVHAQPSWSETPGLHGVREDFAASGAWPMRRADVRAGGSTNRAVLAGVPGLEYYSTMLPEPVAQTFVNLGAPWAFFGRAVWPPDDPLAALFASSRTYTATEDGAVEKWALEAFPMVRVLTTPASPRSIADVEADELPDPFANRNALVDAPVYTTPPTRVEAVPGQRGVTHVSATCRVGSQVQLFAPTFNGSARLTPGGEKVRVRPRDPGGPPRALAPVVSLGRAAGSGVVLELATERGVRSSLEGVQVGCLDERAVAEQASVARGALASLHIVGSTIAAEWARPVTGDVVIASVAQPGWTCQVDEGAGDREVSPTGARAGLMTVPVSGAESLRCSYRTPGLALGAATSAAAAAACAGFALRGVWRRPSARNSAR